MYDFIKNLQNTMDAISYAQECARRNLDNQAVICTVGPPRQDIIDVTDFTVKEGHGDESQTEKILIEAES